MQNHSKQLTMNADKLLPLLYLDLEHRIRQALGGLLH